MDGSHGVSLAPTLTGVGHQRKRDYLIHEAGGSASIIRGRYKLIISRGGKSRKRGGEGRKNRKAKETATQSGARLYE